MYDLQLICSLIVIGILLYSAMIHGLVYYRLGHHKEHGAFSLLCLWFAAYAGTNVIALYLTSNLHNYVTTSKLSSIFVMFAVITIAWFATEYLKDKKHIPLKPIILAVVPFFVLNLFMPNGILWSSIDGIALSPRSFGANVMQPVNPVVSWPMYGLWTVIAVVYALMVRAAYLSLQKSPKNRGLLLLGGIILLTTGFVFDMLIDFGINRSYIYVSEFVILIFVVLMSLHLSDELRLYERNLETLVEDRTEALEQSNKEMESFAYTISHDLRAPLRAIHGFSAALKEDYIQSLDANAQEFLQKIMNNVKRMESMIDGILQLSRLTSGALTKTRIDISQLASQIVEQLKQQNPDRQVTVSIENNIFAVGDQTLIRIILQNLIDNAWKFTGKSPSPTITISSSVSDQGKKGFVIRDNGAGFDPKYADKLFAPFQRLHSEQEFSGDGIGLATVARIVNRHGGKIRAEGEEGKGASFYVFLE